MQLTRALELLVLGLSAMSVAEATFVGINPHHDARKGIQRRQDDDDAPADTAAATTPKVEPTDPPAEPTTKKDPPPPVVTTSTTEEDKPPTTSTTSDKPPPTTSSSTTSNKPPVTTSSSSQGDSKPTDKPDNPDDPTDDKPEETAEATTFTFTEIITSTREDGSPTTISRETVSTRTPDLASGGGDENKPSEGMSPTTRNTVIGVVVGVGGAIILGGLALVAWRIWGRKKHQEENDGLMDYGSVVDSKPDTSGGGSGVGGGSLAGRSPFQSTLESYHAPTQVNTAANF
jgi:outer membrane biosynthesis protein TonB